MHAMLDISMYVTMHVCSKLYMIFKNICNVGASVPDMYTLTPWACGPQALGVHPLVPMLQIRNVN